MQITTIKIHKKTKSVLDKFKTKKESYDTAINKLVSQIKHKDLEKELKEAYQDRSRYSEFEEWENASSEVTHD